MSKFWDRLFISVFILFIASLFIISMILVNGEIQCSIHGYRRSVISNLTLYCVDWNNYIWPLSGIDK